MGLVSTTRLSTLPSMPTATITYATTLYATNLICSTSSWSTDDTKGSPMAEARQLLLF